MVYCFGFFPRFRGAPCMSQRAVGYNLWSIPSPALSLAGRKLAEGPLLLPPGPAKGVGLQNPRTLIQRLADFSGDTNILNLKIHAALLERAAPKKTPWAPLNWQDPFLVDLTPEEQRERCGQRARNTPNLWHRGQGNAYRQENPTPKSFAKWVKWG
ncbi:MAG: hypothetical protein CM15mP125_0320 [Gammaproteobacteria bacterium]|nr:MAG: hypothetical protein CM15mP125_0320 [Gammaproteobacteria bacterium]